MGRADRLRAAHGRGRYKPLSWRSYQPAHRAIERVAGSFVSLVPGVLGRSDGLSTVDQPRWPMKFKFVYPKVYPKVNPKSGFRPGGWDVQYFRGPRGEPVRLLEAEDSIKAEEVAREFRNETILGLDVGWNHPDRPNAPVPRDQKRCKIALACEDRIGLFHVNLEPLQGLRRDERRELIAPTLRRIIESPAVIKANVGIGNDFRFLRTHFKLQPCNGFELNRLHTLIDSAPTRPSRKPHAESLSALVSQHLHMPLSKFPSWMTNERLREVSRWHAVNDAYASFMLFHCLNAKRLSKDPTPPFPGYLSRQLFSPRGVPSGQDVSSSEKVEIEQLRESSFEDTTKHSVTAPAAQVIDAQAPTTEAPADEALASTDTICQSRLSLSPEVSRKLYASLVSLQERALGQGHTTILLREKHLQLLAGQPPTNMDDMSDILPLPLQYAIGRACLLIISAYLKRYPWDGTNLSTTSKQRVKYDLRRLRYDVLKQAAEDDLRDGLRKVRETIAKEHKVGEELVATDDVLQALATRRPSDLNELRSLVVQPLRLAEIRFLHTSLSKIQQRREFDCMQDAVAEIEAMAPSEAADVKIEATAEPQTRSELISDESQDIARPWVQGSSTAQTSQVATSDTAMRGVQDSGREGLRPKIPRPEAGAKLDDPTAAGELRGILPSSTTSVSHQEAVDSTQRDALSQDQADSVQSDPSPAVATSAPAAPPSSPSPLPDPPSPSAPPSSLYTFWSTLSTSMRSLMPSGSGTAVGSPAVESSPAAGSTAPPTDRPGAQALSRAHRISMGRRSTRRTRRKTSRMAGPPDNQRKSADPHAASCKSSTHQSTCCLQHQCGGSSGRQPPASRSPPRSTCAHACGSCSARSARTTRDRPCGHGCGGGRCPLLWYGGGGWRPGYGGGGGCGWRPAPPPYAYYWPPAMAACGCRPPGPAFAARGCAPPMPACWSMPGPADCGRRGPLHHVARRSRRSKLTMTPTKPAKGAARAEGGVRRGPIEAERVRWSTYLL
ncbi:hypothetical protein GGR56DRAFT_649922 [Xylariaceae sp. FL0804]|nr:hypothetical protein GGR56DRAFT_649922 [Xylariaceae sp. FL0804]